MSFRCHRCKIAFPIDVSSRTSENKKILKVVKVAAVARAEAKLASVGYHPALDPERKPVRVVLAMEHIKHPRREWISKGQSHGDSGGSGVRIVAEADYCAACAKEHKPLELFGDAPGANEGAIASAA